MNTKSQHYLLISEVSSQTGVNPITLRAWERRYGILKPKRTEKGHRLYSENDVSLIKNILVTLEQGVAIGQINYLIKSDIPKEDEKALENYRWHEYLENILQAIKQFNFHKLDNLYNDILSLYPIHIVTKRLILPLLETLGKNWKASETGIAEEHFFSIYLRNKIGVRLHHEMYHSGSSRIIFACLPCEHHEFGLLLFALYCLNKGCHPVILGANLPFNQLEPVARITKADAIVLKGALDPAAYQNLNALAEATNVPIFIQNDSEMVGEHKFTILPKDYIDAFLQMKKVMNVLLKKKRKK